MALPTERAAGDPLCESCTRCDHSDFLCEHEAELELMGRIYAAAKAGQPLPAELLTDLKEALDGTDYEPSGQEQ